MTDVTRRPPMSLRRTAISASEWYETTDRGFWHYSRNPQEAKSIAYVEDLYSITPYGTDFRQSSSNELESRFFRTR